VPSIVNFTSNDSYVPVINDALKEVIISSYNQHSREIFDFELSLQKLRKKAQATALKEKLSDSQRAVSALDTWYTKVLDLKSKRNLQVAKVILSSSSLHNLVKKMLSEHQDDVPHAVLVCHQQCFNIDIEMKICQAKHAKLQEEIISTAENGNSQDFAVKIPELGNKVKAIEEKLFALSLDRDFKIGFIAQFSPEVRKYMELELELQNASTNEIKED